MTRHAIALPASRWRTCLRGSVVGLAIWFGKPSSTAQVTVESYTDYASFVTRLGGGGSVTVIGFDDVSTSGDASFSIAADRYKLSDGIVITGEDGQFVSQTFEYASDYPAVSSPNTYAPGPENGSGNTTEATFFVGTTPALVPGFGVFFVDIDFGGPASLTVRDAESAQLATTGSLPNFGNGTQVFRGFVTVEAGDPVAAISSAQMISGSGWPVTAFDGVVLDDMAFGTAVPIPEPSVSALVLGLATLFGLRRRCGGRRAIAR